MNLLSGQRSSICLSVQYRIHCLYQMCVGSKDHGYWRKSTMKEPIGLHKRTPDNSSEEAIEDETLPAMKLMARGPYYRPLRFAIPPKQTSR